MSVCLAKTAALRLASLMRVGLPVRRLDRVYCAWSQVATVTGRLAASNPSIQTIPNAVDIQTPSGGKLRLNCREAFLPRVSGQPKGCSLSASSEGSRLVLLAADFAQIEMRVLVRPSRTFKSAFRIPRFFIC